MSITDFIGKKLLYTSSSIYKKKDVVRGDETIFFFFEDRSVFKMFHRQDCSESVSLEDVIGCDLVDFNGKVITEAYATLQRGETEWGTSTWTFYNFVADGVFTTLRWFGESSGYYSEEVEIAMLP